MRNNFLILSILLFTLFLLPVVSANVYKQGSDVDIKVSCLDIDCGTTTEISIEGPDTKLLVDNVTMTTKDGFVNYTLSDTSDIGDYNYYLVSQGGTPEYFSDSFEITTSGGTISTGQGILFFALSFILLIFFTASLYLTIATPYGDYRGQSGNILQVNYNKYLKYLYGFITYVLLMFIMFTGKGITGEYGAMDTAYTFFDVFSTILVVAAAPVLIATVFFVSLSIISDKRNLQALKRGIPQR